MRLAAAALGVIAIVAVLLATGGSWRARASRTGDPAASAEPAPEDPMARLAAELNEPDVDRRVEAGIALRALGEPAVPAFVGVLRDGDPAGRVLAVRSLGRMGGAAAAAVPALVVALDDPALRLLAIEALAAIGDREAVGALLPLLVDPGLALPVLAALERLKPDTPEAALAIAALVDSASLGDVPRAALRALEAMGPAALPALPTLLRAFEDPDLLSPAIEAVGAIGPAASAAVPALVAVLVEGNVRSEREREEARQAMLTAIEDGEYRVIASSCSWGPYPDLDASTALAKIGEAAVPQVLALLAHESDGVRWDARRTLGDMGDAVVPHLAGAAGSADEVVRAGVAVAIGELAKKHPELLDALARLSRDADATVRKAALASLGAFGAPAGPAIAAALDDPDPEILAVALGALARATPRDPALVPRLVKLLDHEYPVCWNAADAIAAMGEAAGAGIPALVRCLGDECPYMRESAREALETLGPVGLPALLAAVDQAPAETQRGTLRLLAAGKEIPDEGRDACRRLLLAADAGVRAQAAAALAVHGARDAELLPHLAAGLAHDDRETRKAVDKGIAALGDAAAPLLPEVLRAVAREGERMQEEVYFYDALAAAGSTDPGALAAALVDESWDLRYAARVAAGKIGEPAVPALATALAKCPAEERSDLAEILGKMAKGSVAAREALEAAQSEPALRLLALGALWKGTRDAGAVVPALLREVRAGGAESAEAAALLASIGANAAFAVKEIRAAYAAAEDEQVRTSLAKLIDAIERR